MRGVSVSETDLLLEWADPAGTDSGRARRQLADIAKRFKPDLIQFNSFREATFGWPMPVLVVYGEHDAAAIPPIAERIERCRAARPDLESRIIPDCGHWAMYEAPETVNRLLLDFHGRA